jgi:hypothetical protein
MLVESSRSSLSVKLRLGVSQQVQVSGGAQSEVTNDSNNEYVLEPERRNPMSFQRRLVAKSIERPPP